MKLKDKIKSFNFEKISLNVFIAVGVLFVFGLLFSFMNILPYWINLKVLFVLFIGGGVWFLVEKIKKIPEDKRDNNPLIYVSQYLFLLGLIVIAINQFLKRQIIIDWMFEISVFVIAFGFLTFYSHRNKVEKEIEDEKIKEENKEKKRKGEFDVKFPRINKIPVLRNIVKIIYIKGVIFFILLFLILLNSFMISINNLDTLPLQNDEFLTHNAVNYILNGNFKISDLQYGADTIKSQIFYSRGLPYSLGVTFFVKILEGDSLNYFNLRFFSVICWGLTLIIFYLILRKYLTNTPLLFSLYGFSIFYLNIYYSRVSRMYSLFMLIFFALILGGIKLIEKLKKTKDFPSFKKYLNIQKKFISSNILNLCLFFLLFIIGIKVHYHIFFVLIIFYIYLLININKYRELIYPIILSSVIGIGLILFHLFISPLVGKWYFNSRGLIYFKFIEYNYKYLMGGITTLILFAFPLFIKKIPKIIKIAYTSILSIVPLYLFVFDGTQFHEPRYMMFIYPFYLIIVVYGIYLVSKLFCHKNKLKKFLFILPLFLFFVTPFTISGVCGNNFIISCPISHESKIFNLDRWNYDYDDIYSEIKEDIEDDTLVIGRTIHKFYLERYNISNEVYPLIKDINYPEDSFIKYPKEELNKKDLIFIVYPDLIYVDSQKIEELEEVYNYLNHRKDKSLIYESEDKKTLIYHLPKVD